MKAVSVIVMGFALLAGSSARAQTIGDSLRLNVATPLVEYVYGEQFQDERKFERMSIGPRSALGLGVGYGFRERLIVGADLWLGYEVDRGDPLASPGSGAGQQFNLNRVIPLAGLYGDPGATLYRWSAQVAPYLELALGRRAVRPFVGVMTLFALHRDTLKSASWSSHQTGLQLGYGVGGGVHVFLSDAISLDGAIRVSGTRLVLSDDVNQHAVSISAAVILGFSGWIR